MPSPSSRNLSLGIVVKKDAKVETKLFLSSPVLLDLSFFPNILSRIPGKHTTFIDIVGLNFAG